MLAAALLYQSVISLASLLNSWVLVKKIEALEPFHPDRIASRILGMGDVLSLVEEIEQKVDRKQAEKISEKSKKW